MVDQREVQAAAHRPVQPIIDPEANAPRMHDRDSYPSNPLPHNRFLNSAARSGTANAPSNSTEERKPSAPATSVDELEEFRQYQAPQREDSKFEKYLIEPEQIEPSSTFGVPPVGSEQRHRIDEAKIEARVAETPKWRFVKQPR